MTAPVFIECACGHEWRPIRLGYAAPLAGSLVCTPCPSCAELGARRAYHVRGASFAASAGLFAGPSCNSPAPSRARVFC